MKLKQLFDLENSDISREDVDHMVYSLLRVQKDK